MYITRFRSPIRFCFVIPCLASKPWGYICHILSKMFYMSDLCLIHLMFWFENKWNKICVKCFLQIPQKILRQTECLLFNFGMMKFTITIPKIAENLHRKLGQQTPSVGTPLAYLETKAKIISFFKDFFFQDWWVSSTFDIFWYSLLSNSSILE